MELYAQRHSLAHILAQAVQRTIDPAVQLGTGPAVDNGFYYDMLFSGDKEFGEDQLKILQKTMEGIVKEKQWFASYTATNIDDAKALVAVMGQDFKIELLDKFFAQDKDAVYTFWYNYVDAQMLPRLEKTCDWAYVEYYKKVTEYLQNIDSGSSPEWQAGAIDWRFVTFIDLCEGWHCETTADIVLGSFTLNKVAGAYRQAKDTNPMMTRIYGLAFADKQWLKDYQAMMEEAKKRDHRVLGQKLDLFSFSDYGPGFPFFHNNGMIVINELQKYWRETHIRDSYEEIKTPILLNQSLWELSGHRSYYKENMYTTTIDEQEYAVKPMNCPGGMLVYKHTPKSYRDLPLRAGEFGQVHRHELSGTLNGLFRVRTFTQDDAHIFCAPDQFTSEIIGVIDLIFEMYATFGFTKLHIELSTRPEKYVGDLTDRDIAEKSLQEALREKNIEYTINEWDGAFYGPKIDFKIFDAIGREWQCGTVQLDFSLPKRFELEYVAEDGEKHTPIMLHRVVYGSLERFFGILIEHFAGAFPVWLAPTQVQIVPVAEKFVWYAENIGWKLKAEGLRFRIDDSSDSFSKKIRNAELMKVPYIVIVGEQEETDNSVSIRVFKTKEQSVMDADAFVAKIKKEYVERSL